MIIIYFFQKIKFLCIVILICILQLEINAQTVSDYAGTGISSTATPNLHTPIGLCFDNSGNLFIVDRNAYKVKKFLTNGTMVDFVGSTSGFNNHASNLSLVKFNLPTDICRDINGNFYIVDKNNNRIRKVSSTNVTTTFAGLSATGFADGNSATAKFDGPVSICIDTNGNLFVVDQNNSAIRKITPAGDVSTFAGGTNGTSDGNGTNAQFDLPNGICIDKFGNLFVSEFFSHRIRKIAPNGDVTTFAGDYNTAGFANGTGINANFNYPGDLTSDILGNIYVADAGNHCIRKITQEGVVTTIAGTGGTSGHSNTGTGLFNSPNDITIDNQGNLYVSDANNYYIRKITMPDPTIVATPTGTTVGYPRYFANSVIYYSSNANPNDYIFGIKPGTTSIYSDSVNIEVLSDTLFSSFYSQGVNQKHASYLMKRSWDFKGTMYGGTGSVGVRFFYENIDSTRVITQRNIDSTIISNANPSSLHVNAPFVWFKTVGVPFNASWRSAITGNKFPATHIKLSASSYGTIGSMKYVDFANISSFSGGTGGTGYGPPNLSGNVALPVTWAGFEVKSIASGNDLTWSTASEQNSSYFEVEYSTDGKNFISTNDKIKAAGNSADLQIYKFNHANLSPELYYRIKQVDVDDRVDYSVIKVVKRAVKDDLVVNVRAMDKGELELEVDIVSPSKSALSIQMIDLTGKSMVSKSYKPKDEFIQERIDISSLQPGIYFLEVKNAFSKKIIKVLK